MSELLRSSLSAAVPMRIMELRARGPEPWAHTLTTQREEWVRLLTEKGDVLQYGGGPKGEVTLVFNALSKALAHLAFLPGGVDFAGMHFEATWTAG